MKKGIVYGVLLMTVIGILLFFSFGTLLAKFLNTHAKSTESLDKLASIVSSSELNDGDIESTPLYLDDRSVIAGFSKFSGKIEKHNYHPNNPNPDQIAFRFTRPKSDSCPIEKACVCLCMESYNGLQDPLPESTECNDSRCRAFDSIDFLPENIIEKENDGSPKSAFIGGFIYFRSKNSPLPEESIGTRTLYIQRHKNTIAVCTSSPCISDESKAAINAAVATD